jgi:hypothetical protein
MNSQLNSTGEISDMSKQFPISENKNLLASLSKSFPIRCETPPCDWNSLNSICPSTTLPSPSSISNSILTPASSFRRPSVANSNHDVDELLENLIDPALLQRRRSRNYSFSFAEGFNNQIYHGSPIPKLSIPFGGNDPFSPAGPRQTQFTISNDPSILFGFTEPTASSISNHSVDDPSKAFAECTKTTEETFDALAELGSIFNQEIVKPSEDVARAASLSSDYVLQRRETKSKSVDHSNNAFVFNPRTGSYETSKFARRRNSTPMFRTFDNDTDAPRMQTKRFDNDLYTPQWVRFAGSKKEGLCELCDGGRWLQLKNSAFW